MLNPKPSPPPTPFVARPARQDLGAVEIQTVFKVIAHSFAPTWRPASPAAAYLAVVSTASGRIFTNVALARGPTGAFSAWLSDGRRFADPDLAKAIGLAFSRYLESPAGATLIVPRGADHD